MKFKVIKSYTTIYNVPIVLSEGDVVKLGEEEKQEKWLGWIWAVSDNNSGWIPKQIVKSEDGITGIITDNYTAKELNANKDDIVSNIRELNGWLWVKNIISGEEGWIPKENVEIMNLPPYDIFPVLTSDNILLREILPSDINDIIEISYYDSKQAADNEEALDMLHKIERNYRDGNSIHWGIADKESNVIMGTCGYYRGFKNNAGELGCVLKSQFRGKGIMTSAMRSAIAFGFNEMLLQRVFAITNNDNFKAIKLMERLEFKKTSESDDSNVEYEILRKK